MKLAKFLLLILGLLSIDAFAQELAVFSQNNFEGWRYNRNDMELNLDNISHHRIRLYKNSSGVEYTLDSPVVDCSRIDSVSIIVDYVILLDDYPLNKMPLSVIIKDSDGNKLSESTVPAEKLIKQNMKFRLKVPSIKSVYFTIAAHNADSNYNGAVRNVTISEIKNTNWSGDVNKDGLTDVTDLNSIISCILEGNSVYNCDVNGDGLVDITDVNSLISIILKS